MKQLLKLTGCLAVAGLFVSCQSVQQEANYQVIPLPQEIVVEQGVPFILKSGVKILYPEGNEKMQRNAKFLADYLKTATGKDFTIEAGTEGKNAIILALGTENENPEAYQLKVAGDGVTITGSTEAGVFYGIQSLRKSLPIAVGANIALPAVEIKDAPRFGYRGAHFDTSRHFFTVDEIKTYIDMQALHNMNRLHWHITDDQGWRLEIKKYPKLTEIGSNRTETVIGRNSGEYDGKPYGGFYTQKQAKEIVEYAHKRNIWVEAELGCLPGFEDFVFAEKAVYTNPQKAKEFIALTGCDALAVAVGTSHGGVRGDDYLPLDLELMKKIAAEKPGYPFVLHGAASLPPELITACNEQGGKVEYLRNCSEESIAAAVKAGAKKVNMDVDNFLVYTTEVRKFLNEKPSIYDPRKYLKPAEEAFQREVMHKMLKVLGSSGQY